MSATAKIIRYSIGPHGRRIVTAALRYWRPMHGEFLTHRDFSRNSSSSRAVPVAKMLQQVWHEPAGPSHWGSNRPGMQATEELTGWRLTAAKLCWSWAAKSAAFWSWVMMKIGLHKQVANRVTEPYQYIHTLLTATELDNFFGLRRHKDAQPEMRELADALFDAMAESSPIELRPGQWHLPFVSDRDVNVFGIQDALRMSTARCARVSFMNHDGSDPDPVKDIQLHDRLVGSTPIHASPTEHQVQCMPNPDRFANFIGFRSYRHCVESKHLIIDGKMVPITFGELKSVAK